MPGGGGIILYWGNLYYGDDLVMSGVGGGVLSFGNDDALDLWEENT